MSEQPVSDDRLEPPPCDATPDPKGTPMTDQSKTTPAPRPALAANSINGTIHGWFSLSYSNFAVLHRTLMQSMPVEWQERMVTCLTELRDAFEHVDQPEAFKVEAATEREVGDLTDEEMAQLGITEDWYRGDTPAEGLSAGDLAEWEAAHENPEGPTYWRDGSELEAGDLLLLPAVDPIPHYRHAYIEPRHRPTP